jgi:hypothetical protein
LPFDRWSANSAPEFEHLVIFSIVNVQPRAAATLAMAQTNVVQSWHEVL